MLLGSLVANRDLQAGVQDGPDSIDPLGVCSIEEQPREERNFVFTSDIITKGHFDADATLRLPTNQECWDGCNSYKVKPSGCMLSLYEKSEEADGTPHCHCIFVCMPTLKYYL